MEFGYARVSTGDQGNAAGTGRTHRGLRSDGCVLSCVLAPAPLQAPRDHRAHSPIDALRDEWARWQGAGPGGAL